MCEWGRLSCMVELRSLTAVPGILAPPPPHLPTMLDAPRVPGLVLSPQDLRCLEIASRGRGECVHGVVIIDWFCGTHYLLLLTLR